MEVIICRSLCLWGVLEPLCTKRKEPEFLLWPRPSSFYLRCVYILGTGWGGRERRGGRSVQVPTPEGALACRTADSRPPAVGVGCGCLGSEGAEAEG